MEVPPLKPTCDPVSGLVGHEVQAVPGSPYGFQIGPHWLQASVDYEGEDAVLLYARDAFPPYGTADMLRVSINRLWNFGPATGTPKFNTATFTFRCNAKVPSGICIMPDREEVTVFDAVTILKRNDKDRAFIHFTQGDRTKDWRIDNIQGALCLYCSAGKPSSADNPGRLMAKFFPNGDVWFAGRLRTEPK